MRSKHMRVMLTCNRLPESEGGDVDIQINTSSLDGEQELSEEERSCDIVAVLIMGVLSVSREFGLNRDDIMSLMDSAIESLGFETVDDDDMKKVSEHTNELLRFFYKKSKELN